MKLTLRTLACAGLLLSTSHTAVAAARDGSLTPAQQALNGYWRGLRAPGPGGPSGGPGSPPGGQGGRPPPTGPLTGDPNAAVRGGPGGNLSGTLAAKLQPWAAQFRDNYLTAEAAGQQMRTPNNLCIASSVPGVGVPGGPAYSIAILVEPKQVTFLYEENRTMRFVYIDQEQPASVPQSWLGHSVGHWDGDTLVVDTIGFNDQNIATESIPVTHQFHVVQRLRVVNGVLEDQAVLTDPGAFTGPVSLTNRFEHTTPFQEYICAENNHEGGVPTATGKPTPYVLPGAPAAATGLIAR